MSYVTRSPTLVGQARWIWLCSVAFADEDRNGDAAAAGRVATNAAAIRAVATPARRSSKKGARVHGAIRQIRNTPSSSGGTGQGCSLRGADDLRRRAGWFPARRARTAGEIRLAYHDQHQPVPVARGARGESRHPCLMRTV